MAHDHDAGSPPEVLAAKREVRERVWASMAVPGIGRFPRPANRIPNFVGAEAAAERLRGLDVWQRARTIKANPDSPQWPVRQRALEDGKTVFMAVPRLAEVEPFFLLDPDHLADTPRKASSIKGASGSARRVEVSEMDPVDLVIVGCVGVTPAGERLGKGGGFADLEFAIAWAAGVIGPSTIVATTVHDNQVLESGAFPVADHDIGLDVIVTPTRVIDVAHARARAVPSVDWSQLTDEKVAAIPILQELRRRT